MEKEEGEHQGQGLPCPYSHLSLLVLTLAMGTPFSGHARGPPAPQLTLWVGDRLHAVLGAAAALASGTPGWHLHPAALPARQCHLPGRLASCAVPPLPCWGRRWEPAQAPAPLPCPPELLTHCLAWQPVLGVPQDAVPCWHPLSMLPPERPADSPNNSVADKNHKATSALPWAVPHGACPTLSAQPGAGWGWEPSWGVPGAWSPPGPELCASALPAGPPQRMTPIKRSSSCLVDNKTLFFFLFYS